MIHTRFDLVMKASSKGCDRTGFAQAELLEIPKEGETVNLRGYPFIVVSRGWSISDDGVKDNQYAYVRVVKYGEFSIEELDNSPYVPTRRCRSCTGPGSKGCPSWEGDTK